MLIVNEEWGTFKKNCENCSWKACKEETCPRLAKPGKWSLYGDYWFKCEKCNKTSISATSFCPHCGSKMEV